MNDQPLDPHDRDPTRAARRSAELATALARVRARIREAAEAAGRDASTITLVVVTKTHPVEDLRRLAQLGVRDIGESREQEFTAKYAALAAVPPATGLVWHFVGRLQSNKARRVGEHADLVHSVDRSGLLEPLARGARSTGRVLDVLVQVSLDGDPARGGVPVHDGAAGADRLLRLAQEVAESRALAVRGIMAVAPLGADPVSAFSALAVLAERLRAVHPAAQIVSAGMSGDLEAAVAVGATHLRVGSAILGSRPSLG